MSQTKSLIFLILYINFTIYELSSFFLCMCALIVHVYRLYVELVLKLCAKF